VNETKTFKYRSLPNLHNNFRSNFLENGSKSHKIQKNLRRLYYHTVVSVYGSKGLFLELDRFSVS
jgi:hypothetical protein